MQVLIGRLPPIRLIPVTGLLGIKGKRVRPLFLFEVAMERSFGARAGTPLPARHLTGDRTSMVVCKSPHERSLGPLLCNECCYQSQDI